MMDKQNLNNEWFQAVQSHPFFQGVEMGSALSLFRGYQLKRGQLIEREI